MTAAALTIGVMPKSTGNPYFEDCRRGAEEAARDLAAASAHAAATGALEPGVASFRAGRLGNVIVRGDEIRLGRCHIVTKGNLDSFQ